jgi:hypothetical protein
MDAPCVLPRERPSHPGDERFPAKPSWGESGQGIQALRLADAPGEEGRPFAPTRSDCRQCDPMALAVSCRGGQHRSTDRPNEI